MYEEEYEETLSLTDIIAYILHHWKPIIILSVVFMVLVGGLLSYRDYSAIQNKYVDETYSTMTRDLTESQISNAQQFYKRYQTYKQRIADNQFYLDNSLKMKIDPNKVSVYTVQYLVSSDYQGIINSFTSSALDLDDYEEIKSHRGFHWRNLQDWLPGAEIYNCEDFMTFISDVHHGKDAFKEKRNKLMTYFHSYTDGKNSAHVLSLLGIHDES